MVVFKKIYGAGIPLCIVISMLTPLISSAAQPPAKETSWHQDGYWFRDDDGNEAEATGWGLSDTFKNQPIVITNSDEFKNGIVRLRIGISAKKAEGAITPRLAFKKNGGAGDCTTGDWTSIENSLGVPFIFHASSYGAHAAPTTQQLNQGGIFSAGQILTTGDSAPTVTLQKNNRTEYEWSLRYSQPFITEIATYTFRAMNTSAPLDTYESCPAITITPPPPTIPLFTVTPTSIEQGGSASISWSSPDAIACTVAANPTDADWVGEKTPTGTQAVSPKESTSYSMTCANGGGATTQSISLIVNEVPPPPPPNPPPPPMPKGASSGQGPSERPLPPSSIGFAGKTSPGARVQILAHEEKKERNIPIKETIAAPDGSFTIRFFDTQGFNSYSFIVTDKEGRTAQSKTYNFNTPTYAILENNLFVSPTLGFARSAVSKGDFMTFMGYGSPESPVTIRIDRDRELQTTTQKDGSYRVLFNTGHLSYGPHTAIAEQGERKTDAHAISPEKTFTISRLMNPKVDLDGDGAVDIRDLSAFLFNWASTDIQKRKAIDLNGDNTIDISDFSVFIRTMKQQ